MKFNHEDFRNINRAFTSELNRVERMVQLTAEISDAHTGSIDRVLQAYEPIDGAKAFCKRCMESLELLRERTLQAISVSDKLHVRASADTMAKAAGVKVASVISLLRTGQLKLSSHHERRRADSEADTAEMQLGDAIASANAAINHLSQTISEVATSLLNIKIELERPAPVRSTHKLVRMATTPGKGPEKLAIMQRMNASAAIAEQVDPRVLQDEEDRLASELAHHAHLEQQRLARAKVAAERRLKLLAEQAVEQARVLAVFG